MKTLRVIVMAVVAVLVSANFVACSKDAISDPFSTVKKYANEKKLTKIVSENVNNEQLEEKTVTLKYDSKGRLVETVTKGKSSYEEWSSVAEYVWTNDAVIYREEEYSGGECRTYECRYKVSKGLVRKLDYGDDNDGSVSYNRDGRYNEGGLLEWDGDKLMCTYGDYMSVYTYGEPCKSGYYPFFSIDGSALFYAHPELLGVRTKQLPVSCRGTAYYAQNLKPYSSTYEYEFNAEGYVTKQKVTEIYESGQIIISTDTFTWE